MGSAFAFYSSSLAATMAPQLKGNAMGTLKKRNKGLGQKYDILEILGGKKNIIFDIISAPTMQL